MAFAVSLPDFSQTLRRAIRAPLFFAVVGLGILLLLIEAARPCFFLHDDNATWFIGSYAHDFRVVTEQGRLAKVNYYQYGGEPFLEQGQTGTLYPPVYLGVILAKWVSGDLRWTIEWLAAMHLALGLFGFYSWLRQGGVVPRLAALTALAWVLNPFVLIVGSSWVTVFYVVAWLPWVFWALDRLYLRPSPLSALFLGAILGFFFLQGYVQWFAYAALFATLYGLFRFVARPRGAPWTRLGIIYYALVGALFFIALILPLLLPMLHATDASIVRSKPMALVLALDYRVLKDDLVWAQFCLFRPRLVFGTSTAILYCPALLLLPLMFLRFFAAGPEIRRMLFPLLFLALLAILFTSRWHFFLWEMPVMDNFRWPFKVFIFVDFFVLAALAWTLSAWKRPNLLAPACLATVLLAGLAVSLSCHDGNMFSKTGLPSSDNPLPPGVDPRLGRVMAIDTIVPETSSYRFLTHCYGTYFQVPSLGGYDPLVTAKRLHFALGLDFPNIFSGSITPEIREQLDARSVRYWIVDPNSPQLPDVEAQSGLKLLVSEPDRIIFENTQALPLVYSAADPTTPCAMSYFGNSILIPLSHTFSPLEVSVGPTEEWWYRIDHGPWRKGVYEDNHLQIDFQPTDRLLEISFYDSRFREGAAYSFCILLGLGLWLAAVHFFLLRRSARLKNLEAARLHGRHL